MALSFQGHFTPGGVWEAVPFMNPSVADRPVRLVRFGAYKARVQFDDCDDLLSGFRTILRGWEVAEVPDDDPSPPIIRFSKRDGRFCWRSRRLPPPKDWTPHGPRKVMDAVADFHYRFLDWHSHEFTDHLCLHCAAVEMNAGLVIFPSVQKAGKSTLITELALRGHRVFCDDVLPVDLKTSYGIAMGILPRLRLPLPDSLSAPHAEFVRARIGLSDRYAAYIDLDKAEMADFGSSVPIRAIVLLKRQTGKTAATISKAGKAEVLAKMIDQNFARHLSPTAIFDEMLDIVGNAQLRSLEFSDVAEAAGLIEQECAG